MDPNPQIFTNRPWHRGAGPPNRAEASSRPAEQSTPAMVSSRSTPTSGAQDISPKELALRIADIIDERQGMDVSILDVTGPLVIADYFVVATVRNDRHGVALARELIGTLKGDGVPRRNAAGMDGETGWVLLDFDEVVVHLFVDESRDFYDLENLWSDAPRVDFTPREQSGTSPDADGVSGAIFPDAVSGS